MLDVAVDRKIEGVIFIFLGPVKVAFSDDEFVFECGRHGDHFARWGNNTALTNLAHAFFYTRFGYANNPRGVLISPCLHREQVVKIRELVGAGPVGGLIWRVVSQQNHFCTL
jgi:hypothetical protein